jgi:hypothetical protein
MGTLNYKITQKILKSMSLPSDRVTSLMTSKQQVTAAIGIQLKVNQALKKIHANEWI